MTSPIHDGPAEDAVDASVVLRGVVGQALALEVRGGQSL